MALARSTLLHFALHWPAAASVDLWPFAVDYAVWVWNHTPDVHTRLSPHDILSQSLPINLRHIQRTHVFGCPTYVLDPTLQDGKKLPKWKHRSRLGINLGPSPHHSTTVSLVLNPETGAISPQYHCVFDDHFSTVFSSAEAPLSADVWTSLVQSNLERSQDIITSPDGTVVSVPPDSFLWDHPDLHSPVNPDDGPSASPREPSSPLAPPREPSPGEPSSAPRELVPSSPVLREPTSLPREPSSVPREPPSSAPREPPAVERENSAPTQPSGPFSPPPAPLRRSTRSTQGQRPSRLIEECNHATYLVSSRPSFPSNLSKQRTFTRNAALPRIPGHVIDSQRLHSLSWNKLISYCNLGTLGSYSSELLRHSTSGYHEEINPSILSAAPTSEDTPTWEQAMNGPNAAGFWEACKAELRTLEMLNVFQIVDRRPDMSVVSTVWAFRIKRYPDGSVRKLKARFCARGFEQTEGIDYFETFAPVVNWQTVRLLLIISILLGLPTKQVDYTAAFVQADIDTEVYVSMPRGFSIPGKVYKLNKSLYGLKQSPRNYFHHLKGKLEKIGFRQSDSDPCLFIKPDVICLIYVDDQLLFGKDQAAIDNVISDLKKEDMPFEEEDDVAGFLGVHIIRHPDGTIELTQTGLIQRCIDALKIDHLHSKRTPASMTVLGKDPNGEPPDGTFNYASVIGMLLYLSGHSRPDIALAVAQCARFTHNPKRSHELALIRIGQYLKHTPDKGLILKPKPFTDHFAIDVYVDAAFAVGWGVDDPNDPSSVKSRTGYVIEVMGCPVVWVSKLQSTIATSTMEAEYTALSMALRSAIPLHAVCEEVIKGLDIPYKRLTTFKTTIHEDNEGAMKLANMEPGRTTPRSKFYALRMHWFRSWLKPRDIVIQYINTKLQKADSFTKPLTPEPFESSRYMNCGW